jgi:hypothetical protein
MRKCPTELFLVILVTFIALTTQSFAETSFVRVSVAKAGLIVGAGAGHGVIIYEGREYRFRITGLSLGLSAGVSTTRLEGQASNLNQLRDFAGAYAAVGFGGAWFLGGGSVQLQNDKGVMITLQGHRAGLEVAANLTGIRIEFAQPVN